VQAYVHNLKQRNCYKLKQFKV